MPGLPAQHPCPICEPGAPCPKHCGSKKRQTEGLCQLPKGHGTDHPGIGSCNRHGGSTRNHIARANGEKLTAAVQLYGAPIDVEPTQALRSLVNSAFGHVVWLAAAVADMETSESLRTDQFLLDRYDKERALLARMTKDAITAGIEERQVRLAEEQGRQFSELIRNILTDTFRELADAGLALDVLARIERDDVPAVIRRHLTPLAASTG